MGSSLAWSPCGRRVAVGCEKTLGDSMLGMVFFNGFFVLFCDVLSTLYLYFIHDLPLLSNFNGDLPIKNVW